MMAESKRYRLGMTLLGGMLALVMYVPARALYDAHANPDRPTWGVVPGVVVVKLKPDVEPTRGRTANAAVATGLSVVDQVASDVRARSFDRVFRAARRVAPESGLSDLTRFYRLEFDVVRDPAQVALAIAEDPGVELAEVVTWHAVDQFIPNDPDFDDQWHHMEGPLPTQDNDIDAVEAWEVNTGDPHVIVAIMDTGVLWWHPDLRDQIWINPGEDLDGDGQLYDPSDMNGIDDDSNGYIDDLIGWDFVQSGGGCNSVGGEDCTLADNNPSDFHGHGTHVSGITASATNNGINGAGVAGGHYPLQRGCLIMPTRCGWDTPDGLGAVRTDYVGEAVNYAFNNGARVGNLSAGAGESAILSAALNNAFAGGFIWTKSAGNDNVDDVDAFDDYQTTIAVAATNSSDQRASFSNYGLWVDISAPGVSIWAPYGAGGTASWASLSGTSMAAPMVAGCAALIYANNPTFSKAAVESTLYANADSIAHLNPGYEFFLGAGRVNIGNALLTLPSAKFTGALLTPPASAREAGAAQAAVALANIAPDTPLIQHVPFTVAFTDQTPGTPTGWSWDFGDSGTSTDQNPQHTYTVPGVYDVTLDAMHAGGEGRKRLQNIIVAQADTGFCVNARDCLGPGKQVAVEVDLTNGVPIQLLELPLKYQGPADLVLDSTSFDGSRVEYFESKDIPFTSTSNKYIVFRLTANNGGGSPPLAPGSGKIVTLYFHTGSPTGGPSDTLSPVDTVSILNFRYYAHTTRNIRYVPEWRVGGLELLPYCRGDFDLNGSVTSADIINMVNHVFKGGSPSPDPWTMDPNCDLSVTSADIIYLVNFVFKGGPAPC